MTLHGHPTADFRLPKEITFITSEELHAKYPGLDVHGRENAAVKEYGAIFIIGMGWFLGRTNSNQLKNYDGDDEEQLEKINKLNSLDFEWDPPLGRRTKILAPAYDDWSINGDIIVMHPLTGYRHELVSMGVRVNSESIVAQLNHRRLERGGIGISRLLMLLLRTAHIGEVQCGVWHDEHYRMVSGAGIDLIPDRIIDLDSSNNEHQQTRKKKKNKYAQFSKQETLDPMDTLLLESRSKLKDISKLKQSNKKQAEVYDSLVAVEELLSSMSITSFDNDEEQNEKVWERNRRKFPDNKDIDPYDPTTYPILKIAKSERDRKFKIEAMPVLYVNAFSWILITVFNFILIILRMKGVRWLLSAQKLLLEGETGKD
ncbi:hypothetical protein ACHAWO_006099 [Cyclotella atomus]|uniref:Aminoacyl-transfer RNA synthetases class-II family profile domain-containing protein n=1 Tax=Cyclotella atomus TaxID=382360 RepID=A0ABD3PFJ5_9STRA